MTSCGKGSKRSEVNLEKHLEEKKSTIDTWKDDLCMAAYYVLRMDGIDYFGSGIVHHYFVVSNNGPSPLLFVLLATYVQVFSFLLLSFKIN